MSTDSSGFTGHKKTSCQWIEANRGEITDLGVLLWEFAEPALREFKSVEVICEFLREQGFEVEEGIGGMPTAFLGTFGSGKPVIATYAEYDAPAGNSQRAVPRKEPVVPYAPGHTQHNLLAAAAVGGITATKVAMEEHGIEGTIKIFGTPGEKLAIGKPFLASNGFFDGLDAVVGQHPWHINAVTWDYHFDPYMVVDFRFHGKYNYVFGDGRSAVDALVMMISSIGNRKVVPVSSLNKVILVGGQTLEFYSEYAEVMFSFGAKKRAELDDILGVFMDCAEAAANVTKCTYEMRFVGGNRSYLPNHALAELVHRNLEMVGPPRFTEGEKEFCRQIQESLGMVPDEEPLDETIKPMGEGLKDDPYMVSFDDGNEISWYAPFQWFNVACSPKYSEPWIPCATVGTSIGRKAAIVASKVLVCSILDLLTDPSELERCREEFESRISGRGGPEAPIISPGTKPPVDLPLPEFTGKETIIRYPTEGRTPLI